MSRFSYLLNSSNEVVVRAGALAASASSSLSLTTLPASNATILPVSLPWRSANANQAEWLEIDFGVAVTVDFVAAVGHNMTSGASNFRFFSGVSTNPVDEIWNLLPVVDGPGSAWAYRSSGSVNHRYWRLQFDEVGHTEGYYEVGYIVVGVLTEFGFGFEPDYEESLVLANRIAESESSSPLVGELVEDRREVRLNFGAMLASQATTFRQFLSSLKGGQNPLFVVPDTGGRVGFFGRLQSPQTIGFTHRNQGVVSNQGITFREDGRGLRIKV